MNLYNQSVEIQNIGGNSEKEKITINTCH